MTNRPPLFKVKEIEADSPKFLLLYGPPKIGKTTVVSKLANNLIIDGEHGTRFIKGNIENAETLKEFLKIVSIINEDIRDRVKEYLLTTTPNLTVAVGDKKVPLSNYDLTITGIKAMSINKKEELEAVLTLVRNTLNTLELKDRTTYLQMFPYKYVTIDTIDKLEDLANEMALSKYAKSIQGKNVYSDYPDITSIMEIEAQTKWDLARNCSKDLMINLIKHIAPHIIWVGHTRDKNILKKGVEVSSSDLALTGKLKEIICAEADVIVLIDVQTNINPNNEKVNTTASYNAGSNKVMGTRIKRLAGKKNVPFNPNMGSLTKCYTFGRFV